jgi:hypothetical protein
VSGEEAFNIVLVGVFMLEEFPALMDRQSDSGHERDEIIVGCKDCT